MKKIRVSIGILWGLILITGLSIGTGKSNAAPGNLPKAGDSTSYSVGGVAFELHYVPGGLTFPTAGDPITTGNPTVAKAYWIDETDVTYQLWSVVYKWAIQHGYTFDNPGLEGGGRDADGGNRGGGDQQPVTAISWSDAMIWCNALTEYHDGNSSNCVYYIDPGYTKPFRQADKKALAKPAETDRRSFWGGS